MSDDTTEPDWSTDTDESDPLAADTETVVRESDDKPADDESQSFGDVVSDGLDRGTKFGSATGEYLGRALGLIAGYLMVVPAKALETAGKTALTTFSTIIPRGERAYRGLAEWAVRKFHRSHGEDLTGFVLAPDGMHLDRFVHKQPDEEEGEGGERGGWHGYHTDYGPWEEAADGRDVETWGSTPIGFFDSASDRRATVTQARVAEAMDLGRGRPLVENAALSVNQMTIDAGQGNGANAIADGGVSQDQVRVDATQHLKDFLVDIGPDGDYDGMQISLRKVKEVYQEKGSSEQHEEAKKLGFLAGRAAMDERDLGKILMWVALAVAAAAMGPELVSSVFSSGGGGGGGSGIMPFQLRMPVTMLLGW